MMRSAELSCHCQMFKATRIKVVIVTNMESRFISYTGIQLGIKFCNILLTMKLNQGKFISYHMRMLIDRAMNSVKCNLTVLNVSYKETAQESYISRNFSYYSLV
jgi:hypothetical protein